MCLCQGLQFFYWIDKSCIHNFVSHYFVFSCVMEIIIKIKNKQKPPRTCPGTRGFHWVQTYRLVANRTATWKEKFPQKANAVILDMNWSIDWLSNSRFNCGASPEPPVGNIVAVTAGGTCAVNVFARPTLTSHADLVRNPASVPACSYIYCTFPSSYKWSLQMLWPTATMGASKGATYEWKLDLLPDLHSRTTNERTLGWEQFTLSSTMNTWALSKKKKESDSNTDVAIYVNLLLCIHYMNEVQMHLGIPLFFDVTQSKSNTIINVLYHLSVTQHMSSQNWLHFQTALRLFGPFAETIKQLICNGK